MPLGFGLEITGESNAVASDESGLYWQIKTIAIHAEI